jgi:DNA replication and repair protein RecF
VIVRGIDIVNFRNIAKAALSFSPTFNVITGRNAQGKTNLLEAIHLFSLGRSFRTRSLEETIRFGEEYLFCRLSGKADSGVDFDIEVGVERAGRIKVSINGKKAAGLSEILGIIPSVIFVAEDILLAAGPPAGRRAYLDYTAAQISPGFLRELREYRGILRRRNVLLEKAAREGTAPEGIEPWDDAFIAKGASLVRIRIDTMREIESRAETLLAEIMNEESGFDMEYVCSFDPSGTEPKEALERSLARVREAERRRGFTMAGPHYDDVQIFLEGAELRRYGSQGRKRLAALVLKLAQALTILDRRGEKPVVILDDIFSELDRQTARRVREHLTDSYQSFITTPRPGELGELPATAARFVVESGVVAPGGIETEGAPSLPQRCVETK